jgi:5-methylcytosine-specific restriction endonuclease McrA
VPAGQPCPCQAAERADWDRRRGTASQRGYDAGWRKLRARFLAANPQCEHPGCRSAANEVDHIQSVRLRPDLRLEWSNLRALCKPHHSQRTAREQGFARRTDY